MGGRRAGWPGGQPFEGGHGWPVGGQTREGSDAGEVALVSMLWTADKLWAGWGPGKHAASHACLLQKESVWSLLAPRASECCACTRPAVASATPFRSLGIWKHTHLTQSASGSLVAVLFSLRRKANAMLSSARDGSWGRRASGQGLEKVRQLRIAGVYYAWLGVGNACQQKTC